MNVFTLLSEKNTGLLYGASQEPVLWFESTAAASHVDMEQDEPDFDVLVLSNVRVNDYVIVRADAEVEKTEDDGYVHIREVDGCRLTFRCYKVLTCPSIK